MWFFSFVSSAVFLLTIILSIPIAFDVGGRDCGLAFSFALFWFYAFHSVLRLATPETSRVRYAFIRLIGAAQWIIIPGLLIWSMNKFAVDANNTGDWVRRTFDATKAAAADASVKEWLFGKRGMMESLTIGNWELLLKHSSPVFQLAEGFCSLLVIQAAGQITRWLVNKTDRSDTWMVSCWQCFVPLPWMDMQANRSIDQPASSFSLHNFQLCLLLVASHYLSRHIERRCHPHRHDSRMRRHTLRLGHRQRPR